MRSSEVSLRSAGLWVSGSRRFPLSPVAVLSQASSVFLEVCFQKSGLAEGLFGVFRRESWDTRVFLSSPGRLGRLFWSPAVLLLRRARVCLRFVPRFLAWRRVLVCSGWRVGIPGCFCLHRDGWASCSGRRRGFRSPEFRRSFTRVCFQAQKGPIVLEVVLSSPLQLLVSVFSVVFFSPSGSGWFSFFFIGSGCSSPFCWLLFFSFYHVCLCESGREVPGGSWGWRWSFSI